MKRTAGSFVLLAALGGCVSTSSYQDANLGCGGGQCRAARSVPGLEGPRGEPVAVAAPYSSAPHSPMAARDMMSRSLPLSMVQQAANPPATGVLQAGGIMGPTASSGVVQASGFCPPGGCGPAGIGPPGMPMGPGVPGMMGPNMGPSTVAAAGTLPYGQSAPAASGRSSVRFAAPAGMKVSWIVPNPAAKNGVGTNQVDVPGRYNFLQANIYRLKLSNIPNRPGVDLYPTLEVVPTNYKTAAFLAHSSVPLSFTDEDFEQVFAGHYLVKVIYLPDPQYQDLATTGPDEVVSSRLEPGVDPIVEAHRRGNILLVVRMGNIDLEAPNTPAMDAPNPYHGKAMAPALGVGPAGLPALAAPGGMQPPPGMIPGGNSMMPPALPTGNVPPPPPVSGSPIGKASDASGVQTVSYQSMTPAGLTGQLRTR